MTHRLPHLAIVLAIGFVCISPVTATVVLSTVSFLPDAPLVPGGQQQVVATYAIIPSGSTTFAPGHSLQMQTDLTGAQWTIQVTLDGRDAARQTASGSVAFVNGELLSYGTNRDIGIVVTADGTVPANASGSLTVLTVKELDTGGNVVPGSILAISQPVAGPVTPRGTSVLPTLTPPLATTPTPKGSPGFVVPVAITALVAAVIVLRAFFRER
ncbi:MAG: hypothetical protein LUQ35_09845 [Methanoregula sp.]|jgi:PGF-CTERM protein|nr:hypothetical protein [Methanoregula sp.]